MFANQDSDETSDPLWKRVDPHRSGHWRRSSYCTSGTCVETLLTAERVSIRDGKQTELFKLGEAQPVLHVSPEVFAAFLAEVSGEQEPGANGELLFAAEDDGAVALWSRSAQVKLTYNADEWQAFCAGVAAGEFAVPPHA